MTASDTAQPLADQTHLRDAWRIAWTVGAQIVSPLRGRSTEGAKLTQQLMRRIPLEAHHGIVHRAECHPRVQELGSIKAPANHAAPHPDCYCGIHACERLEYLEHLAKAMSAPLRIIEQTLRSVAKGEVEPPGIVVYRVLLEGAIESALYKHAKPNGRGFYGDPPGTWRAARAKVVGPMFTTREADRIVLGRNYTPWASYRGSDPVQLVAELRALEPPSNPHPCGECRYVTYHATRCSRFECWWKS